MVIKTNSIFVGIPKIRNTHPLITIAGVDVTSSVVDSTWIKPATVGIGTFRLKLNNAMGRVSEVYSAGDDVKFYCDNSDGTYMQFWGRLDYPKDIVGKNGQFLEIEGRHRSWRVSEILINHSARATDHGQILKDIVDAYLSNYGFTYNNVKLTGVTTDIELNYVSFIDFFRDLCHDADFDGYIDDDLDIHFFEANSIHNEEEAIAENDNYVRTEEWGKDDYYERTRVSAVGQDNTGIPILHTSIVSTGDSGDQRELFIKDINANTELAVKSLGDGLLNQVVNRPKQGVIKSMGLVTLKPGDNLWVAVPRQKIYGIYKALEIRHLFGMKTGGWRTITTLEHEAVTNVNLIENTLKTTKYNILAENPNKLEFSYNLGFDDDTKTFSHLRTEVSDSNLVLTDSEQTTGTWISTSKLSDTNITSLELRYVGTNLTNSSFYFSLNDGVSGSWEQFSGQRILTTPKSIGRRLKVKVILSDTFNNKSPQLDSIGILYS